MPNNKDFEGSAQAILRLQDVYHLNANHIVDGKLEGSPYLGTTLNWFDCYVIGKAAYDTEDYQQSYEWMKMTEKFQSSNISIDNRVGILGYMAFAAFQVPNLR